MIPTTTKDRADANLLDGLVSRPRAVYTEFPQVRTISHPYEHPVRLCARYDFIRHAPPPATTRLRLRHVGAAPTARNLVGPCLSPTAPHLRFLLCRYRSSPCDSYGETEFLPGKRLTCGYNPQIWLRRHRTRPLNPYRTRDAIPIGGPVCMVGSLPPPMCIVMQVSRRSRRRPPPS